MIKFCLTAVSPFCFFSLRLCLHINPGHRLQFSNTMQKTHNNMITAFRISQWQGDILGNMPFLTIQLLQSQLTHSNLSTDQPGNILCCFLCQKEEHSVITAFFLCLSIQRTKPFTHVPLHASGSISLLQSREAIIFFCMSAGRAAMTSSYLPALSP